MFRSQKSGAIPDDLRRLYNNFKHQQSLPAERQIFDLLEAQVKSLSKGYIIIDALDECREEDDTRERFLLEISKLAPHVLLMITSRDTGWSRGYF